MKRLALPLVGLVTALLGARDLYAQTPGRFRLGVMAGTQATYPRVQSSDYIYTNAVPERLGWMAGMVGQFDIMDKLSIEASLGVSRDEVHTDGTVYEPFYDVEYPFESNEDYTWIENSISLKYRFLARRSFSLYGGVGINTHRLLVSHTQGQYRTDPGLETTQFRLKWNYSLPIATGVEFPLGDNKLSCTFAYHVGLRGVYAPIMFDSGPQLEDGLYKLNAASVSVAYLFSVPRRASTKK